MSTPCLRALCLLTLLCLLAGACESKSSTGEAASESPPAETAPAETAPAETAPAEPTATADDGAPPSSPPSGSPPADGEAPPDEAPATAAPTEAQLEARDAALEQLTGALGEHCELDTGAIAGLLDEAGLYRAIDEIGLTDDARHEQSAAWLTDRDQITVEVGQALCGLRDVEASCGEDSLTCSVAADHFETYVHFVPRADGTLRLAGVFATNGMPDEERAAEIETSRKAWLEGIERGPAATP